MERGVDFQTVAALATRFGRGFGEDNLRLFRALDLTYPPDRIPQMLPLISESLIRNAMHKVFSPIVKSLALEERE